MSSIAILVANSNYTNQTTLPCCEKDLEAIRALVESTGKFSAIHAHKDITADQMREVIRNALPSEGSFEEIFFYFSGHGVQLVNDYFYCGTDFIEDRPNETGLSYKMLLGMFRACTPSLLVNLIDACESGTPLIKSSKEIYLKPKDEFKNFIQIASCLDYQESFTGNPLSEFTKFFCKACIKRQDGHIYYSDIINTLRDDFIKNEDQTPFFVTQGTGRELFVDDATKLTPFRNLFQLNWSSEIPSMIDIGGIQSTAVTTPAPAAILAAAEAFTASQEKFNHLVHTFFEELKGRILLSDNMELFDGEVIEYSDFNEKSVEDFIGRVLTRETARLDNFVTAKRLNDRPSGGILGLKTREFLRQMAGEIENFEIHLNCTVDKVQIKFTLKPKFKSLKLIKLVVTCIPSLEKIYIFEIGTFHLIRDWDSYDEQGEEFVRRWYKINWDWNPSLMSEKISITLKSSRDKYVDEVVDRLSKSTADKSD